MKTSFLGLFPLLSRGDIEALIDSLIEILDSYDSPFDDLEAEHDTCDALDDRGTDLPLGDYLPGTSEDAETEWDACEAGDDLGTEYLKKHASRKKMTQHSAAEASVKSDSRHYASVILNQKSISTKSRQRRDEDFT